MSSRKIGAAGWYRRTLSLARMNDDIAPSKGRDDLCSPSPLSYSAGSRTLRHIEEVEMSDFRA